MHADGIREAYSWPGKLSATHRNEMLGYRNSHRAEAVKTRPKIEFLLGGHVSWLTELISVLNFLPARWTRRPRRPQCCVRGPMGTGLD